MFGADGSRFLIVRAGVANPGPLSHTLPMILQWDESLDIGSDTLTGVADEDYQTPFAFTGKTDRITLTIDRPTLSPDDIKKLEQAQRENKTSQ